MKIDKKELKKLKHETNINKKKVKTIKKEWKQMKQGKEKTVKKI